jgi:hypothetical protein
LALLDVVDLDAVGVDVAVLGFGHAEGSSALARVACDMTKLSASPDRQKTSR